MKPRPVMLMVRELGVGGSERQLTEIAKTLDRARFEPHVGCFRGGFRSSELRAAGVPVLELPVTSFRKPSALAGAWALGRYWREHGIELVHTFDYPLNIYGVPVARFFRVPAVLSSQRSHRGLRTPFMRRLLRVTDRLADAVVVNCEAVRRHLIEDEGVPPRRIRLCYNGVDLTRFQAGPRLRPAGLEEASLVIGVVSVLRPEKGLHLLLEAFSRILAEEKGARLLVVGGGSEGARLRERAAQLGILEFTRFEPAASDVVPWLRAIDLFVLPSLSEALSNSILEAMACGCTVIASRVGGNPELVRQGETGLLFEKGDAAGLAAQTLSLMHDPGRRQRLAEQGTRMVEERFSLEASVRKIEAVYEEFLTLPHKRSA